jgi:polyvinyl alcohol dehydrogenase (cytochrome)
MAFQGRVQTRGRVKRGIAAAAALTLSVLALGPAAPAHEAHCSTTQSGGGDWRQFGNQLSGDRRQGSEHFIDGLRAAQLSPIWTFDANEWSLDTNNEITGYPIVANGCVYVGSSTGWQTNGWIFALNADTGQVVWQTETSHGVYSTLAVVDGVVYAFVSKVKLQADTRIGGPYVLALDQATGEELWRTTVDYQIGSDAVSSPVVFDGMVWVGVSATAAEVSEGDRGLFQGSSVFLEAGDLDLDGIKGEIIRKTYTIDESEWAVGYAGAAQWGTIAIDPETGYGYEGIGNPFDYDHEHQRTNAVIKMDVARARDAQGNPVSIAGGPADFGITNPNFGKIVGEYKGDVEAYAPVGSGLIPCNELEDIDLFTLAGIECLRLDLDFGAQPNIFKDSSNRRLVGIGQKSGVYHVFDADTMEPAWQTIVGVPSPVGGIVGSASYDGTNLYGPHTIGGYLFSLEKNNGGLNWLSPVADAVHWGPPVPIANNILYTVDLKGFLDAYDAGTGLPLLHRPMALGADTHLDPTFSWGGVTVARNTVFASIGVGLASLEQPALLMPNGFVIAYRPLSPPLP